MKKILFPSLLLLSLGLAACEDVCAKQKKKYCETVAAAKIVPGSQDNADIALQSSHLGEDCESTEAASYAVEISEKAAAAINAGTPGSFSCP